MTALPARLRARLGALRCPLGPLSPSRGVITRDGGIDEFVEFFPSCDSSSTTRARSRSISAKASSGGPPARRSSTCPRSTHRARSVADPHTPRDSNPNQATAEQLPLGDPLQKLARTRRCETSELDGEAHVGMILRRLCFVGFREHGSAELDRWAIRRMHQPLHRLTPGPAKIGKRRLDEQPGQSSASLISAHGSDHQVAVIVPNRAAAANESFVRADTENVASLIGDDHVAVLISRGRIGSPLKKSRNDLGDLVQPRPRPSDVERFELLSIAAVSPASCKGPLLRRLDGTTGEGSGSAW